MISKLGWDSVLDILDNEFDLPPQNRNVNSRIGSPLSENSHRTGQNANIASATGTNTQITKSSGPSLTTTVKLSSTSTRSRPSQSSHHSTKHSTTTTAQNSTTPSMKTTPNPATTFNVMISTVLATTNSGSIHHTSSNHGGNFLRSKPTSTTQSQVANSSLESSPGIGTTLGMTSLQLKQSVKTPTPSDSHVERLTKATSSRESAAITVNDVGLERPSSTSNPFILSVSAILDRIKPSSVSAIITNGRQSASQSTSVHSQPTIKTTASTKRTSQTAKSKSSTRIRITLTAIRTSSLLVNNKGNEGPKTTINSLQPQKSSDNSALISSSKVTSLSRPITTKAKSGSKWRTTSTTYKTRHSPSITSDVWETRTSNESDRGRVQPHTSLSFWDDYLPYKSYSSTSLSQRPSATSSSGTTFYVPQERGESLLVDTRRCIEVCPTRLQQRNCFRFHHEIPTWPNDEWYLSYACLVCLNSQVTLHAPDHYEVGNDMRETQDLIDAIWDISREAGLPP